MISKMSHSSLFVLDQDKAYDFYVNKLGFTVKTDTLIGGDDTNCEEGEPAPGSYRWITLNPPQQPDLEIILMPVMGFPPEADKAIRTLLNMGMMGAGVFETSDCQATYEELKAKGVEFASAPKEQFYGIECIMKDGCGNWFSLCQRKPETAVTSTK